MKKREYDDGDIVLMENFEEIDDADIGLRLSKERLSAYELDLIMNPR